MNISQANSPQRRKERKVSAERQAKALRNLSAPLRLCG